MEFGGRKRTRKLVSNSKSLIFQAAIQAKCREATEMCLCMACDVYVRVCGVLSCVNVMRQQQQQQQQNQRRQQQLKNHVMKAIRIIVDITVSMCVHFSCSLSLAHLLIHTRTYTYTRAHTLYIKCYLCCRF